MEALFCQIQSQLFFIEWWVCGIITILHIILIFIALELFNPTYYLTADDSFTLTCTVKKNPHLKDNVTFKWSRNATSGVKISSNHTTSQMIIERLNPDDHSGDYTCEAYYNYSSNGASESTTLLIES